MKKTGVLLLTLLLFMALLPAGQASADGSVLVAYFSRSGNTGEIASEIARRTSADVFRIVPVDAYPSDYQQTLDRARRELSEDARPEFISGIQNMASYDTVFIGYPIWYGDLPCVVRTFLDHYDLSGKTVVPFCTSGGSGISGSLATLERLCPASDIREGLHIPGDRAGNAASAISAWLEKLGLNDPPTEPDDPDEPDEPIPPAGMLLRNVLTIGKGIKTNLSFLLPPSASGVITWHSDNEAVLRVTSKGKESICRGLTAGDAQLTAVFADGTEACVTVHIVPPKRAVSKLSIKSKLTLRVGGQRRLTASVRPQTAIDRSLIWFSDKASVATVDNGLIRAISAGRCNVYALTSSGRRARVAVTVQR